MQNLLIKCIAKFSYLKVHDLPITGDHIKSQCYKQVQAKVVAANVSTCIFFLLNCIPLAKPVYTGSQKYVFKTFECRKNPIPRLWLDPQHTPFKHALKEPHHPAGPAKFLWDSHIYWYKEINSTPNSIKNEGDECQPHFHGHCLGYLFGDPCAIMCIHM